MTLVAKLSTATIFGFAWAGEALAQAHFGERPEVPGAREIAYEVTGWLASHPGVAVAIGSCVVVAIATYVYNRMRPID